jgi:hypothetical protein
MTFIGVYLIRGALLLYFFARVTGRLSMKNYIGFIEKRWKNRERIEKKVFLEDNN